MLVIISDLHLTDGTSGDTISAGAFRAFRERLRDMAYDASWRTNGEYKPIESLDIVLLGDILDLIRSTKWPASKKDAGYVRPWDARKKPDLFQKKIAEISRAILRKNKESLDVLKSLSSGSRITLPRVGPDKKPVRVSREPDDPGRGPVDVRVHYLVGNHDWFYHLRGTRFNQIRRRVVNAMGLANSPNQPFPHDPRESDAITAAYEKHQVFARHGDIYDPFNYEDDRDGSSLGDAIVVDLLNRFPTDVERKMGGELPKDCVRALKEIDNVRPLIVIPVWVDGVLRRTCPDREQIKGVKDIWDGLVDEFLDLDFVKERDTWNPIGAVDKLELALKFSKGISLGSASRLLGWFNEKFGGTEGSYRRHALTEREYKNRNARYIVYGHTHHQEIVPLDASFSRSGILEQMYMNSGTWRRVHELAQANPKEEEFLSFNVLTYIGFFKNKGQPDDERAGRPFEFWSGALGVRES